MLLTASEQRFENDPVGLFLIDLSNSTYIAISEHPDWNIRYLGINGIAFTAQSYLDTDERTIAIYIDGSITKIDPKWAYGDISPGKKWVIADSKIYDSQLQAINELEYPFPVDRNIWVPDSSGKFIVSGTDLYYISIPEGNIKLVDQNVIEGYDFDYIWTTNP